MSWCTRNVSAALQTLGRWALALTRIRTALSTSASLSTYTWQLPMPVSMDGTVESSTTLRIRAAPPRGMTTSTSPRAVMRCLTDSCDVPGTSWTASRGSPLASSASCMTLTSAVLESYAELEPRSRTALPDLRPSPAASTVTLGRAS